MNDIYHSSDVSAVVDNNILIDLDQLGFLGLLFLVFSQVVIPKEIYGKEVSLDIKEKLQGYSYKISNIMTAQGLDTYAFLVSEKAYRRLSTQDRFAISIAQEIGYYCNSNDQLVRKACEQLAVKFTGILGVLGRAFCMDYLTLDQLNSLLDDLVSERTSCYIKPEVVKQFRTDIVKEKKLK